MIPMITILLVAGNVLLVLSKKRKNYGKRALERAKKNGDCATAYLTREWIGSASVMKDTAIDDIRAIYCYTVDGKDYKFRYKGDNSVPIKINIFYDRKKHNRRIVGNEMSLSDYIFTYGGFFLAFILNVLF